MQLCCIEFKKEPPLGSLIRINFRTSAKIFLYCLEEGYPYVRNYIDNRIANQWILYLGCQKYKNRWNSLIHPEGHPTKIICGRRYTLTPSKEPTFIKCLVKKEIVLFSNNDAESYQIKGNNI